MASIPELAVCYHRNGVVQGYELLKTDDIFLLKGLAEDGTAFFHPHVVQQNASSVLRFLQENCKQDPGTYWVCSFPCTIQNTLLHHDTMGSGDMKNNSVRICLREGPGWGPLLDYCALCVCTSYGLTVPTWLTFCAAFQECRRGSYAAL